MGWFLANAGRFSPEKTWHGDPKSIDWKRLLDAPQLLNALLKDVLNSEYRKVRNSPSLTSRLPLAGGDDSAELENAASSLVLR